MLLGPASHAVEVGLEENIRNLSIEISLLATLVVLVLIGVTVLTRTRSGLIFGLIVATVLATSGFLIGSTIYLNTVSSSGGPVHWHADFEVWNCGQQLELQDPLGFLSNKIGTATLHEHNDKRVHLEGVVVQPHDASLGKFFEVIGGSITDTSMILPVNDGVATVANGDVCAGRPGQLQVFAYQTTTDGYYTVRKLSDPAGFIIAPQSNVPPGDCIIIEFDAPKLTTEHMCRSYSVALQIGKLKGPK